MPTPSTGFNKFVKRAYYSIRNSGFIYKNLLNLRFTSLHKKLSSKTRLNSLQKSILAELEENGIAVTTFDEFFPDYNFEILQSWIASNEKHLKPKGKKKFLLSYYGTEGSDKPIDLNNPFIQIYLSENLLRIASEYLGYVPQLYEVYVEKTIPVGDKDPEFSQNWHRDPEEKRTLKVFMYLNDVDEFAGPFTYVRGSQPTSKNSYSKLFRQKLPWGSYPEESAVLAKTSSEDQFVATGSAGTIIFCDTAGLHRGGFAKTKERVMATGFFPSHFYTESRLFQVRDGEDLSKLGPYARSALITLP